LWDPKTKPGTAVPCSQVRTFWFQHVKATFCLLSTWSGFVKLLPHSGPQRVVKVLRGLWIQCNECMLFLFGFRRKVFSVTCDMIKLKSNTNYKIILSSDCDNALDSAIPDFSRFRTLQIRWAVSKNDKISIASANFTAIFVKTHGWKVQQPHAPPTEEYWV